MKITQPLPSNFSCTILFAPEGGKGPLKGHLNAKVVGVRDYKKQLRDEETSLLLAIISEASGGELAFDPPPVNYLATWKDALEAAKRQEQKDTETLEAQTVTIEQLRSELEAAKTASKNAVERIQELTEELRAERSKTPTIPPPPTVPDNPPAQTEAAPVAEQGGVS